MTKKLSSSTPSDIVWEEAYRPKDLNQLLLPSKFKSQLESGELRNYLFVGPQGTGKTSTAYVLAKGRDRKFIDCSSNRSISMIRDEIANFCSVASLDSNGHKVVILDEMDSLPELSQKALRGTIEKFTKEARFIATCNYPDKILGPIVSRFTVVNFDLPNGESKAEQVQNYAKRIVAICKHQGLEIDRPAIGSLIKTYYPDMRSILQTLQDCYDKGVKIITETDVSHNQTSSQDEAFIQIISTSDSVKLYKYFSAWKTQESSLISSLQSSFGKYIWNNHRDEHASKLGNIAILGHKYGIESKQSIDMFVTMLAYVTELSRALK